MDQQPRRPSSTTSHQRQAAAAHVPQPPGVLPAGKCYCRYDVDWSEWSLSEPECRRALYLRAADPMSGLATAWLDEHYCGQRPPAVGPLATPAHLDHISAFLYRDCTPAPPCSCMDVRDGSGSDVSTEAWMHAFETLCLCGRDCLKPSVALTGLLLPHQQACYNEIQIYAADVSRNVPDAVLQVAVSQSSEHSTEILAWMQSFFAAGSCDAYQGDPYVFAPLLHLQQRFSPLDRVLMFVVQALLASACVVVLSFLLIIAKKLLNPTTCLHNSSIHREDPA